MVALRIASADTDSMLSSRAMATSLVLSLNLPSALSTFCRSSEEARMSSKVVAPPAASASNSSLVSCSRSATLSFSPHLAIDSIASLQSGKRPAASLTPVGPTCHVVGSC